MNRKKPDWILATVLSATLCFFPPTPAMAEEPAQEESEQEPADPSQVRTVIKRTKHVDVRELQKILSLLGLRIRLKEDINAIVLSGSDSDVDSALRLIEALDVPAEPGPTVQLTAYVIAASKDAEDAIGITEGLAPVVDQLRHLFGYRGFELLDNVFLRVRDTRGGRVEGGIVLGGEDQNRAAYQLTFRRVEIMSTEEAQRRVLIDGLNFELNGTRNGETQRVFFQTDVEIREGQKAVVGKSTPRGTDDTLVLILEAQVLD